MYRGIIGSFRESRSFHTRRIGSRTSLPLLFEPDEAGEIFARWKSAGEGPSEEKAGGLVDAAWEARGRRRVLLARQALEIWPDCASKKKRRR